MIKLRAVVITMPFVCTWSFNLHRFAIIIKLWNAAGLAHMNTRGSLRSSGTSSKYPIIQTTIGHTKSLPNVS
nr:hypothetical protein [Fluviispira vulneris]